MIATCYYQGSAAVYCALWKQSLFNNQIHAAVQLHTCCPDGSSHKHDVASQGRRTGGHRMMWVWWVSSTVYPSWEITFLQLPLLEWAAFNFHTSALGSLKLIKLFKTYHVYIFSR